MKSMKITSFLAAFAITALAILTGCGTTSQVISRGAYVDGGPSYLPLATNKPSAGQIPYATDSTGKKWGWGTSPDPAGSAAYVQTNLNTAVAALTLGDALHTIQADTNAMTSISGNVPYFTVIIPEVFLGITTNVIQVSGSSGLDGLYYYNGTFAWTNSVGSVWKAANNHGRIGPGSPSGGTYDNVAGPIAASGWKYEFDEITPVPSLSTTLISITNIMPAITNTVKMLLENGDGSKLSNVVAVSSVYATSAFRTISTDTNAIISLTTNGPTFTTIAHSIGQDLIVVGTSGDGYNGPVLGTVFNYIDSTPSWHQDPWNIDNEAGFELFDGVSTFFDGGGSPLIGDLPLTLIPNGWGIASGTVTIDYVHVATTNVYNIALSNWVASLPVVPLTKQVYVDQGGSGQFTTVTAALNWVNTQHLSDPSSWYAVVLNAGNYAEDVTIGSAYTIMEGAAGTARRAKMTGTVTITNQPVYLDHMYLGATDTDCILLVSNVNGNAGNVMGLVDCFADAGFNQANPVYVAKIVNCTAAINFRTYNSELYAQNNSASANAKCCGFFTTNNSAVATIEMHESRLKLSGNSNPNSDYICWLNGSDSFNIIGGEMDIFHDSAPKVHLDGASTASIATSYMNEQYAGNPYVQEGISPTAIFLSNVQTTRIKEGTNGVAVTGNFTVNGLPVMPLGDSLRTIQYDTNSWESVTNNAIYLNVVTSGLIFTNTNTLVVTYSFQNPTNMYGNNWASVGKTFTRYSSTLFNSYNSGTNPLSSWDVRVSGGNWLMEDWIGNGSPTIVGGPTGTYVCTVGSHWTVTVAYVTSPYSVTNSYQMATSNQVSAISTVYTTAYSGTVIGGPASSYFYSIYVTNNWTISFASPLFAYQQIDLVASHSTSNQVITWPSGMKFQTAGFTASDTNTTGFSDLYSIICFSTNPVNIASSLQTNIYKQAGIQ